MAIFVDTSAILPLLNRSDSDHRRALHIWQRLAANQTPLLTSNYVFLESVALIQSRLGMEAVGDFHRDIAPLFHIIWATEELHRQGVTALLTANRRQLSLVDCISFIICRDWAVDEVFAFDAHFVEYGFRTLSASSL